MAITLVMMAAVVNLFATVGQSVRNRRATIELGSQLRIARGRLQKDLAGATCPAVPWQRPESNAGYIEIVEGQYSDKNPTAQIFTSSSLVPSSNLPLLTGRVTDGRGLGDYDDILALTVRSEDEPFVGRALEWKDPDGSGPEPLQWVTTTIESTLAEVVWYAVENPADDSLGEPGMRTVYRRVLLIAPWLQGALPSPAGANNSERLQNFYRNFDVSVRIVGNQFIPNSLGDLTKRENRFGHFVSAAANNGYPHQITQNAIRRTSYDPASPPPAGQGLLRPFGLPFDSSTVDRQGEDVVLSDVLAFDVRVYDPGAPLLDASGTVVEPSDVGWGSDSKSISPIGSANISPVGFGAYVDLYWNVIDTWSPGTPRGWTTTANDPPLLFSGAPNSKSGLDFSNATTAAVTYDTWSFHYENDGINQGGLGSTPDEGTNGLDDDNINGVDDIGERETSLPYDVPLRGLQVKLRVYERDSRQIRETSVIQSFN